MALAQSLYTVQQNEDFSLLDPNRPDALGAALSAALPVAVLIIFNGLASAAGWTAAVPQYNGVSFVPPTWLASAITIAILPMWGLARWMVWQRGEQGRAASWWVLALITWSLALPFLTSGFDLLGMTFANVISLLLAVGTGAKVFAVSKRAFLLVLPSVCWMGFTTFLGFAAIAQGWSPGFAATQQGAQG